MSLAVNTIIQVDIVGRFNGLLDTHNVFHIRIKEAVSGGGAFTNLDAVLRSVWFHIAPDLLPLINPVWYAQSIKGQILTGDGAGVQNQVTLGAAIASGTGQGQSLPPEVTWTYRKQGSGGSARNGYFHFSGVPEPFQANGFPSDTASLIGDLATTLYMDNVDITIDGDPESESLGKFELVIVKKVANGDNPSDIDVIAYWKPVGVVFAKIGGVDTRSIGRGS